MQIIGIKHPDEGVPHHYSDEDSGTTYTAIYTERMDGDYDLYAIFGLDRREVAYATGATLDEAAKVSGDQVLIIENDHNDFPDVYEPPARSD